MNNCVLLALLGVASMFLTTPTAADGSAGDFPYARTGPIADVRFQGPWFNGQAAGKARPRDRFEDRAIDADTWLGPGAVVVGRPDRNDPGRQPPYGTSKYRALVLTPRPSTAVMLLGAGLTALVAGALRRRSGKAV